MPNMTTFDIIHKPAYGRTPFALVSLEIESGLTKHRLHYDDNKKYEGVLDTCSESTYFPLEWIKELGIEERVHEIDDTPVRTLMGVSNLTLHCYHVRLWLNGLKVPDAVKVCVPFDDKDGELMPLEGPPHAIIGQNVLFGFYTRFDGPNSAGAIREKPCCAAPPQNPNCLQRLVSLVRWL